MSGGARAALLADGRRLHLQHGPIDLIVEAAGAPGEVAAAYGQATRAFAPLLAGLVAELALLRRPVAPGGSNSAAGPVARAMVAACAPHATTFVTPMAAVAGAVADFVLAAMLAGRTLARCAVNNGGDIALHLAPGAAWTVGIVDRLTAPAIATRATIAHASPVRGIATSGQGGRSLSFGIADAVTVLAHSAAAADVAATLIANAVDVASPAVRRAPARSLREDSDLGDRLVVAAVGRLTDAEIAAALDAGVDAARRMLAAGLIEAAYLSLRGRRRVVGGPIPMVTGCDGGRAA